MVIWDKQWWEHAHNWLWKIISGNPVFAFPFLFCSINPFKNENLIKIWKVFNCIIVFTTLFLTIIVFELHDSFMCCFFLVWNEIFIIFHVVVIIHQLLLLSPTSNLYDIHIYSPKYAQHLAAISLTLAY